MGSVAWGTSPAWRFLKPLVPTPVFQSYCRFAAERQCIFYRRLRGEPRPWTSDPVLQQYKFTNAYRASDRTSQYLIRHVIYDGPQEVRESFFRILLFKFFNRIETWELLKCRLKEISWETYSFDRYDAELSSALDRGQPVYSAAYIMPSCASSWGRKHRMHLRLLERMMADDLPSRICGCQSMSEVFAMLRSYPSIGDFLGYQYAIDLNYSRITNFSEADFVMSGPGALDGIHNCFSSLGSASPEDAIRIVTDAQEECFRFLEIEFPTLWGRRLQLIDCQNLFCEIDKYSRVAHPDAIGRVGRTRIKQRFHPSDHIAEPWYPPKWRLNAKIVTTGFDCLHPNGVSNSSSCLTRPSFRPNLVEETDRRPR